jgi:hypothetical protein
MPRGPKGERRPADVSSTLWSINDLVALVDEHDAAKPRQKPGRKPKAESPAA